MPLDRQLILRHAFGVLDEAGLEGLTLRKLAAKLKVQAPALYWHFKNKQELLDEMGTQVLREAQEDEPAWRALPSWRELAFVYCTSLRRTFLRYRDGAKMASGTYLTDTKMFEAMDMSLRRFVSAGFSLRQAVVALTTLYSYTVGFVIEEQATQVALGITNEQYALEARDKRVNKELYPLAAAAGADMFTNHGSRFEEGVKLIVAGIGLGLSPADKMD